MSHLWTARDVADFLRVSVKAVYRLPIPCIVIGARTRRYRAEDVHAFCAGRCVA